MIYFNQIKLLGKWHSVLNKNMIIISIIENNSEVLIPISISNTIMNQVNTYCSIGEFLGVKGKTLVKNKNNIIIKAEKIIIVPINNI